MKEKNTSPPPRVCYKEAEASLTGSSIFSGDKKDGGQEEGWHPKRRGH